MRKRGRRRIDWLGEVLSGVTRRVIDMFTNVNRGFFFGGFSCFFLFVLLSFLFVLSMFSVGILRTVGD